MMTPSQKRLIALVIEVAIRAPLTKNKYATEAKIPWGLVDRIRLELEAQGYDWRVAHRQAFRVEES